MTNEKMAKAVKTNRTEEVTKAVTNFMGGTSYELNGLDLLRMVTASSVFGEPQYYRDGEFAQKNVKDGLYKLSALVTDPLLGQRFDGMKTSTIMETLIDEALDTDFEAVLRWAVELRHDYFMRLNPQIIMVRAAKHPNRVEFNKQNPGLFREINQQVMKRADEPSAQLTYWLYNNGSKNNIPTVLKRSWCDRIERMKRYDIAKYQNANVGLIDTVRVSHAKGELIDELMKNGKVEFEEGSETWERLRSEGKRWTEILRSVKLLHMALLRNLRGIFQEVNDRGLCNQLMQELKDGVAGGMQFPFRYYSAYNAIKGSGVNFEAVILDALEECIDLARVNFPVLKGKTISLSDNSGSAHGAFTSEYGTMNVAQIDNLSSILTAQNSDEGYIGVFGDNLKIIPVSKRNGALTQAEAATKVGKGIGMGTENGIWIFFREALAKKEHYDHIFIYSDMQAGHGGLYGINPSEYPDFEIKSGWGGKHIDVLKLIREYRKTVNPKVNVYCVQTAGYTNALVPEMEYRTSVLYGWTGKEVLYASKLSQMWDEVEQKNNKEEI